MARKIMTDEIMNEELERLNASPYVKLAQKELSIKYKKRRILYTMRNLEKRGRVLEANGFTLENMEAMIAQAEAQAYALEEEA